VEGSEIRVRLVGNGYIMYLLVPSDALVGEKAEDFPLLHSNTTDDLL